MQVTVKGLPAGQFETELVSGEELPPPEDNPEWGPSAELTVMVVGGDYDGHVVTDRMGLKLSKKSRFGKLVRGIIGREPEPGETLDLSQFYGQRYHLLVEVVDGKTRFLSMVAISE